VVRYFGLNHLVSKAFEAIVVPQNKKEYRKNIFFDLQFQMDFGENTLYHLCNIEKS
jgi:hypothetical protein